MTTLSSKVLSPSIVSPVDLRQLLAEVKEDLVGHPKLGLPSNYEGKGLWDYYMTFEDKRLSLQGCTVCDHLSVSH